jgi:hypothetical protein
MDSTKKTTVWRGNGNYRTENDNNQKKDFVGAAAP